jgi:hypothetical protein
VLKNKDQSSESTGYQDKSDGDSNGDGGPTIVDITRKKQKMLSKINHRKHDKRRTEDDDSDNAPIRINRGRIEDQNNQEDDDSNDVYTEMNTRRGNPMTENMRSGRDVRKRMFVDEGLGKRIVVNKNNEYDNEEEQEDGESEDDTKSEIRRKNIVIAMMEKKIRGLEKTVEEMKSMTRTESRDKTRWTGEELTFVKDINDFCKEKIYPKEKFLRKNWQVYLQDNETSLSFVMMKNLSIPEGSDPRDIWNRVIVPSIRDKYQSMRCNMNNKIKEIYKSMRIVFDVPTLLIVCCNILRKHCCCVLY